MGRSRKGAGAGFTDRSSRGGLDELGAGGGDDRCCDSGGEGGRVERSGLDKLGNEGSCDSGGEVGRM